MGTSDANQCKFLVTYHRNCSRRIRSRNRIHMAGRSLDTWSSHIGVAGHPRSLRRIRRVGSPARCCYTMVVD